MVNGARFTIVRKAIILRMNSDMMTTADLFKWLAKWWPSGVDSSRIRRVSGCNFGFCCVRLVSVRHKRADRETDIGRMLLLEREDHIVVVIVVVVVYSISIDENNKKWRPPYGILFLLLFLFVCHSTVCFGFLFMLMATPSKGKNTRVQDGCIEKSLLDSSIVIVIRNKCASLDYISASSISFPRSSTVV